MRCGLCGNDGHNKRKCPNITTLENGVLLYKNGDKFYGEVCSNGTMRGIRINANGDTYNGVWMKGYFKGYVTITYKDGTKYDGMMGDGEYHDDARNGFGKYTDKNNIEHLGNWWGERNHGGKKGGKSGKFLLKKDGKIIGIQRYESNELKNDIKM